jgi:uncharacterized protein YeaO (DUF488 family)
MGIRIGRVYDPPGPDDGVRVLVDRLWPRGLRKDAAAIDEWCKQVAPSTDLRRWYGHDRGRFAEFTRRYEAELDDDEHGAALDELRELVAENPTVTLLTAVSDTDIGHVTVLRRRLGD